jgi:GxxExxY protein
VSFNHGEITEQIVGGYLAVYNTLGSGFSERVYHNALAHELTVRGLTVESEKPIHVYYRGICVGDFFADLVVNDCVLVELKATGKLVNEHRAQILNYLKATCFEVGLLLNFGDAPEHERKAFDSNRKGSLQWTHRDSRHLSFPACSVVSVFFCVLVVGFYVCE